MRLGTPPGVEANATAQTHAIAAACDQRQGCCSVQDAGDARRVAGLLGIPFYVINFQDDFGRVIDYFVAEYNRGRTPNPCIRCNEWLKFGKLAAYGQALGADYIASGHYARIGPHPATGRQSLLRALDHRKDQSYVLFTMTRQTIEHTLFPVGELDKIQVRDLAREWKLPVFNKPDSQEICFVPDQDYASLVRRRTPQAFSAGPIVNVAGVQLGTHPGHQHFTIGQRKGLGVAAGYPLYVVQIEAQRNRVVLGAKDDLLRTGLVARGLNILDDRLSTGNLPVKCSAKIRYNHAPVPATANLAGPDELNVAFDQPQSAIAPGQAVVIYDGQVVLGGGWIA